MVIGGSARYQDNILIETTEKNSKQCYHFQLVSPLELQYITISTGFLGNATYLVIILCVLVLIFSSSILKSNFT